MSHWFGLQPNVEPVPALYWGGRAIFRNPDVIDVVWDRQQFNLLNDDVVQKRQDLWSWIREKGLERLRKELVKQHVTTRDDCLVTVVDRQRTIIANPRKSSGYLYIGAWANETRRKSG